MAKFVHADVLDSGLNAIKTVATRMLLVSAYTPGDGYLTVTGNALCEVTVASADFTLASAGNNRTVTSAAKSGTATVAAAGAPNPHIALTDGLGKVLWVTDETTKQPIAVGDTINFPQLVHTASQPT